MTNLGPLYHSTPFSVMPEIVVPPEFVGGPVWASPPVFAEGKKGVGHAVPV